MKKNYDFSKGVRGAHRDQTFTVVGPVKSETVESGVKQPNNVKITIKTEKRVSGSVKSKVSKAIV